MENLIDEIRSDFQIPPYFPDQSLENFTKEGMTYLDGLSSDADFVEDVTARSLLKNYVYYAYNHKINEYMENYKNVIISWQMGREVH